MIKKNENNEENFIIMTFSKSNPKTTAFYKTSKFLNSLPIQENFNFYKIEKNEEFYDYTLIIFTILEIIKNNPKKKINFWTEIKDLEKHFLIFNQNKILTEKDYKDLYENYEKNKNYLSFEEIEETPTIEKLRKIGESHKTTTNFEKLKKLQKIYYKL